MKEYKLITGHIGSALIIIGVLIGLIFPQHGLLILLLSFHSVKIAEVE